MALEEASEEARDGDKTIETEVVKFGNGAHVIVPRKWIGSLVKIKQIGSFEPPLFDDVEKGRAVFVEVDNGEEFLGEVIEYDFNADKKGMWAEVIIDTGHDFYRITIERNAGQEGWDESEYHVGKAL